MSKIKENKSTLPENMNEYLKFFGIELNRLEEEIEKINKIQDEMAAYVECYKDPTMNRGQRTFIDLSTAQINASAQKQSLLRDIFSLRKSILDYSLRTSKSEEGDMSLSALNSKMDELSTKLNSSSNNIVVTKEIDYDKLIESKLNKK